MIDHSALCTQLQAIARDAGEAILAIYNTEFEVRRKDDASPVTAADEAAEAVILEGLARIAPDIPVIAEESVAAGRIPDVSGGRFWLVDPLDGTKEFINRNGEFTVNIALIENARPVIGVVYAPAIGRMFCGFGDSATGDDAPIAAHPVPEKGLTVIASRSHKDYKTEEFLKGYDVKELKSAGSSLKLCLIAAGEADMYPRLGRTMEWDIAAGHAVLRAAGGSVTTIDGAPFLYGKPGFENPFFIAWGKR